jgi:uncharacterized protein
MSNIDRRTFLRSSAVVGGTLAGVQGLVARGAMAAPVAKTRVAQKGQGGFGPLQPKQPVNLEEVDLTFYGDTRFYFREGEGYFLALPEGFSYTVIGQAGSTMTDGRMTPAAHDGMAAFPSRDGIRLVRNHEIRTRTPGGSPPIGDPNLSYDPTTGGGTTTLVVDPVTRAFASLSGTQTNCAGGPTPWGSWITCEETVDGTGANFAKNHGYNFEVPSSANGLFTPVPLKAMGRFVHEAIAIDPRTGIVYETEDRGTAGFYRFIPRNPRRLALGGKLQMLAIRGREQYDTRTGQQVGERLRVEWVDINDPDPADAESNSLAVFQQGYNQGGAVFARLEGAWYGNGNIYINSTSGGDAGLGQVWQYTPYGRSNEGHLELIFESTSADVLDSPDNICVSPRGALVLCEDGDTDQFVRGLTVNGDIFDIAQNLVYGFDGEAGPGDDEAREFAGATFSPDGRTLFFNVQTPGTTFAIWYTGQTEAF